MALVALDEQVSDACLEFGVEGGKEKGMEGGELRIGSCEHAGEEIA